MDDGKVNVLSNEMLAEVNTALDQAQPIVRSSS